MVSTGHAPAHCDKSPLNLGNYTYNHGTKEKQLLQGRRYANQHKYYCMFGVHLGTAIGIF
jgi:hypothetical protein